MITVERLKEVLEYDPSTGDFRWRQTLGRRAKAGNVAGCRSASKGYAEIQIDGKLYKRHRLAYLYVHGYLPSEIDHVSRERGDDRIDNLRPATRSQNRANSSLHSNNTSGAKGVTWHSKQRKWNATISVNRKRIHLGCFDDIGLAADAYRAAAIKHFGAFAAPISIKR